MHCLAAVFIDMGSVQVVYYEDCLSDASFHCARQTPPLNSVTSHLFPTRTLSDSLFIPTSYKPY